MKRETYSPVTIREVARYAGVSIATVSRVLNDSSSVTAETRERVCSSMAALGYTRNEVARSLKIRRTRTIGIIAPELSNIYFMEVLESMGRLFDVHGYTMVVCSSNNSLEQERRKVKVMMERTVDGLVIIPVSDESKVLQGPASVPTVLLDRRLPGSQIDMVITDNRWGAWAATKALVDEGFSRIGFIGGDFRISTARERYEGYLQAVREAHIPTDERFVFQSGPMDRKTGYESMQRILRSPDHPDAVFVANDLLHLGATACLSAFSISPSDFVLSSFDYLFYTPLLSYCHYAVCQPLDDIGNAVAKLLLRRIADDWTDFPRQIMFKPEVKTIPNRRY